MEGVAELKDYNRRYLSGPLCLAFPHHTPFQILEVFNFR